MSFPLLDIASPLFNLHHGFGIDTSWRITHGEGKESSDFFLNLEDLPQGDFFSLLYSNVFFEGLRSDFFFLLPVVAGRWASAPRTAHLLWIFTTLNGQRCVCVSVWKVTVHKKRYSETMRVLERVRARVTSSLLNHRDVGNL